MSLTGQTFPSVYENSTGQNIGRYMNNNIFRKNDNIMVGAPNPLYSGERERIMKSLENNKNRNSLLLQGGWYSTHSKFEPKGSFTTPFNVNGNTAYGKQLQGSGLLRTPQVQQYYDKLLQERKNQLDALNQVLETGENLEPRPIETTETISQEAVSKIQAMTSNLYSKIFSGEYDKISSGEISDIYTIFLKNGLLMTKDDLVNFYNQFNDIVNLINTLASQKQLGTQGYKSFILMLPLGAGLNFIRIAILIKTIIGVKGLNLQQIKDSQRIVNNYSKNILSAKTVGKLAEISEMVDNELAPKVEDLASQDMDEEAQRVLNKVLTRQAIAKSQQGKSIVDVSKLDKADEDRIELENIENRILEEDLRVGRAITSDKDATEFQRLVEKIDEEGRDPRNLGVLTPQEKSKMAYLLATPEEKREITKLRKRIKEMTGKTGVDLEQATREYAFRPSKFMPTDEPEEPEEPEAPMAGAPVGSGRRRKGGNKKSNRLLDLF
jgi:hypothetical protein